MFDHTSLIRFIEVRFGNDYPDVIETNITPWRRAVVGDLTTAFDFSTYNASWIQLPSTASYLPPDQVRHPDYQPVPPADQVLPRQEPGVSPARALPYELNAHGAVNVGDGSFSIDFSNSGGATAVFQVRSGRGEDGPWTYTIEPGKQLSGVWDITPSGASDYDLSVYGPNGFMRAFKGGVSGQDKAVLDVHSGYDRALNGISLTISNQASQAADIMVLDMYTGKSISHPLKPGKSVSQHWALTPTFGWYDLVIRVGGDSGFEYRLAGHLESGRDSISDPAMGGFAMAD